VISIGPGHGQNRLLQLDNNDNNDNDNDNEQTIPTIVRFCLTFVYTAVMEVTWSQEASQHLARSQRYQDAMDIEVDWTLEAANDTDAVQIDPYWTSRINALAIIGYSPSAGAVLLVLAYRDLDGDLHGMTAWPATGRALRIYTDGSTHDQAT
jgi:hypothetical protein